MSCIKLKSGVYKGKCSVPPSKSYFQRAVICALLCKGENSVISYKGHLCDDCLEIIDCVRQLGAEVTIEAEKVCVSAPKKIKEDAVVMCRNSGFAVRTLFTLLSLFGNGAKLFVGDSLSKRPIITSTQPLLENSAIFFAFKGGFPVTFFSGLKSGEFKVSTKKSTQFLSSLLLITPLLDGNSKIILTENDNASFGYVNMTLNVMKSFGVSAQRTEYGYFVKGGQTYKACNYAVESDISGAAFIMALAAISGDITINNINLQTKQGDIKITDLLRRFGADVYCGENSVRVKKSGLKAIGAVDCKDIPDIVPALAAIACLSEGTTVLTGIDKLKFKESDRINNTVEIISALGGSAFYNGEGIVIHGGKALCGGKVESYNDHRMVMLSSILSSVCRSEVEISNAEDVKKSFPDFFNILDNLRV